ncbi:MAG: AraC family transcriptional regulator [Lysobacter sp.]|nr:MAG: AraC family transcriptional regulator [Lysobacter sp.]
MNSSEFREFGENVAEARLRDELADSIARIAGGDGVHETGLPGVAGIRLSAPSGPLPAVYHPSLCIVVQGRKQATFAGRTYVYDPLHYLLVSTSLPISGRILHATPEQPYLCLRIDLDPSVVDDTLARLGADAPARADDDTQRLMLVRTSLPLLEAAVRLMRLRDEPATAPLLAPLILREIHVRLLTGEMGARLRAVCAIDGAARRVGNALALLRERYAETLPIAALAEAAHMSPSALYAHFRDVTGMSPLQFQKRLRLQEARRLMLGEGLDAAEAGHRVGYESASHFSREYRRLFGAPPRREVATAHVVD